MNSGALSQTARQQPPQYNSNNNNVSGSTSGAYNNNNSNNSNSLLAHDQWDIHDLATFSFPKPADPDEDPTGRSAFSACCEKVDPATRQQFLRFPSHSVIERLDVAEEARLAHCGLGDKGAQALMQALKANPTITDLDLTDNGLTYAGLQTVLVGLTKSVKSLNLASNRITHGCVISESKNMPSVMAQKQGLLSSVSGGAAAAAAGGGTTAGGASTPALGAAAANNASAAAAAAAASPTSPAMSSVNVMTFFVGATQTGSAGYAIGQMLAKNSTLDFLGLKNNKLNDTDCIALAEGLGENSMLHSLDLSNNELGAGSAHALATILMRSELRELDLGWNKLQNTGAVLMIKEGLSVTTVKKLVLAWNGLGDDTAEQLGKVLAGSSPLEEINLGHNNIGTKGAEWLSKGIRGCMALAVFIINNNPLRDEGCVALLRAIQENSTLYSVDMRETGAGDAATAMLPSVLNGKTEKFEIDMPRGSNNIEFD